MHLFILIFYWEFIDLNELKYNFNPIERIQLPNSKLFESKFRNSLISTCALKWFPDRLQFTEIYLFQVDLFFIYVKSSKVSR
jgi:hypothetical protein